MAPSKDRLRFLGTSNISEKYRVTLTKDVVKTLEAEIGGKAMYYLNEAGDVIVKAEKRVL
ncbi:MAG: hypothetical protein NT137_00145 [Methanomassiliicoccales archaeon]|nr:hypothetical protein [Methanomassiliicoccales archaeon]